MIESSQKFSCVDLDQILKEFTQYGILHFGTEEWFFNKFNYDKMSEHVAIHNQFKEKLQYWENKCSIDGSKTTLIEMADYLKNWLEWHILKTDREYVEFFKSKGL